MSERPLHELIHDDATYQLWMPAPGIVLQRVAGKAGVAIARDIGRQLERILERHESIVLFDDFAEMTGYTSEGRIELTEWSKRNWSRIRATHILVGSKLVAMGVSVASIALPGLRSYDDRARFEAMLGVEIQHAQRKIPA